VPVILQFGFTTIMQSVPITTDVVSSNLIRASLLRDRRGRNRMVVGFTTTYVISDPLML